MNLDVKDHRAAARRVLEQLPSSAATSITTAEALADQPPVEVPERFVIDSAEKASWAVRKILEARQYAARVQAWAEGELGRAEREEQWLLRRFSPELEGWLRDELQRRGRRARSVNLPAGTLGLRRQPARLEIVDEARTVGWCLANLPGAVRVSVDAEGETAAHLLEWVRRDATSVRVRQRVLQEPLARHLSETGEIPPGAALRPAEDRFYVK
jgi:hypothetical protein